MIDKIIVYGPLGEALPEHKRHLSALTHARNSLAKTLPSTTFVRSPITGNQIDVEYFVERISGKEIALARVTLPLSTATVGHNYAHAGFESVRAEVRCAEKLVKVILAVLGFTSEEITRFAQGTVCQHLELTWHTATASRRASLCLRKRTKKHFAELFAIKSRHDICIAGFDYREGDGNPSLLVKTKNRDMFRQYSKSEQILSRSRQERANSRMTATARQYRRALTDEIQFHVRNEVILAEKTLKECGLEHPRSWNPKSLHRVVERVWSDLGLTPTIDADSGFSSREVEKTWQKYLAGENVQKLLADHTFTRHRASIKAITGKDIAIPCQRLKFSSAALGKQLSYGRRWQPRDDLRKMILCEMTAPAITEELVRGLSLLRDGEILPFDNETDADHWWAVWKTFLTREAGNTP